MLRKYLKYSSLFAVVFMFTACQKFLSELPTKGTNQPITTIEQLDGLLDGLGGSSMSWQEVGNLTMGYSTDDTWVPAEIVLRYPVRVPILNLHFYTFDINEIPAQPTDRFWANQYALIYRANLILENVDKVDGDLSHKARVKAEAHFLRAYTMWVLANYYCLPYAPQNMQEPGLPRRLSTSLEENVTRMTLAQTYEQIDRDIAEALKIDQIEHRLNWRANRASINAFLSRYYMHRGEFDKAIAAADFALANKGVAKLRDYNTLADGLRSVFAASGSVPADTIQWSEMYTYSVTQIVQWEEHFYVRMAINPSSWHMPSPELVNLFDKENDMRYKWFMRPNGNRSISVPDIPAYRYIIFANGGAGVWSGPTIQEVMLNKAESMLRKSSPDIAGALAVVNELRRHRIAPGASDIQLTATNRDEALIKVLEERRRELPFGHRWWDIRRFSVTETTVDKVSITRTFHPIVNGVVDFTRTQTYTLPAGSRRYAVPINRLDIDASQGQLRQNTY